MAEVIEIPGVVNQIVVGTGATAQVIEVVSSEIQIIEVAAQGTAGADGLDGEAIGNPPPIAFAWNNTTPRTVYTLEMDAFIVSVLMSIETAFNGAGAALSVGTTGDPDSLIDESEVDPAQVADFEINSSVFLSEGTDIVLTTSAGAGATQGNGFVVIKFVAV